VNVFGDLDPIKLVQDFCCSTVPSCLVGNLGSNVFSHAGKSSKLETEGGHKLTINTAILFCMMISSRKLDANFFNSQNFPYDLIFLFLAPYQKLVFGLRVMIYLLSAINRSP